MATTNNLFVLNGGRHPCETCMKRSVCPVFELDAKQPDAASGGTVYQKTTRHGQTIFNAGEAFDGIYMVRSGFFKSYFIDVDGEMQVTGFHFPGEIFGIDGIETGRYNNTVEALDTGSLCKIPFSLFTGFSGNARPGTALQTAGVRRSAPRDRGMLSLVRIMSQVISRDRDMIFALGKMSARRRFAAFLEDVRERMARGGYSRDEIRLCMSRTDMANYLCLAVETISRLFTQFQASGVIGIERRNLKILDGGALRAIVNGEAEAALLLDKAS